MVKFCKILLIIISILLFSYGGLKATEKFLLPHPIKDPVHYTDRVKCDNCGMNRNKWARTRYQFHTPKGRFYTCSIHCLAVLNIKLNEEPEDVQVAEYMDPEKMIDAQKAVYIIGSAAPGTMTSKSKLAFASKEEAEQFVLTYGGKLMTFEDAFREAKREVQRHR